MICFAYPYGIFPENSKKIRNIVQKTGYLLAVTGHIGHNTLKSDLYSLRRIPIYQKDSLFEFKKKLIGAYDCLSFLQRIWLRTFPV